MIREKTYIVCISNMTYHGGEHMFTVRLHKDAVGQYAVEGIDVLAGLTDAQVRSMAEESATIKLQGKIRQNVKVDSASAVFEYLSKTYPECTVTNYTPEESTSASAIAKKLIAKFGKEKLAEMLASA
jgi:hypothetical protein